MKRFLAAATVLAVIESIPAEAFAANTWCHTNWPNAVFCDDFDRYCTPQPPSPEACDPNSDMGSPEFGDNWVPTGDASGFCGSPLSLDTDFTVSQPWSAKMNTQYHGDFGYSVHTLTDDIQSHFGEQYDSLIGTDLNPLVLEFAIQGGFKTKYDTTFLSLTSGLAFAPTDWAWSDWCDCLPPPLHRWPVICQQEQPTDRCPPIETAPDVPAVAVGLMTYLDSNPCHCGEPVDQSPFNEHLSFFDGHKWYKLRAGLFPGSGDFMLRGESRIKLTIKSSSMKVELTSPDTNEYSWCQITGGYTGPFTTLNAGFHKACELDLDTWTCRADRTCRYTVGVPNGGVARYDNIVLHGGACYETPGACCMPDTTCTTAPGTCECQSLGGQFAGPGTTCADTACCPALAADQDRDGDVDMGDFGWFQKCLSGTDVAPPTVPCRCADFDHEGDVDSADFAKFLGCMLGADVAANPNCLN